MATGCNGPLQPVAPADPIAEALDRVRSAWTSGRDSEERFWPDPAGAGWFKGPRTLPVLLMFIDRNKELRGSIDVTRTYLALLAENRDEGIVIINNENDYAMLSGFSGGRAVRSWRERMQKLVSLGFIETKARGEKEFGYVLLVHPWLIAQKLRAEGKITDGDWSIFMEKHGMHGSSTPHKEDRDEPF